MQYPDFVRAVAIALPTALLSSGAVWAQTQPQPQTLTDTAPLPAQERSSNGAVIMMDQPVLAQREQMAQAQARGPDTTSLGAGPARQMERAMTREELERQKDTQERGQGTPK